MQRLISLRNETSHRVPSDDTLVTSMAVMGRTAPSVGGQRTSGTSRLSPRSDDDSQYERVESSNNSPHVIDDSPNDSRQQEIAPEAIGDENQSIENIDYEKPHVYVNITETPRIYEPINK